MNLNRLVAAALLVAAGSTVCADDVVRGGGVPLRAGKVLLEQNPNLEYDPTSVLVRFNADLPEGAINDVLALVGGRVLTAFDVLPGLYHVEVAVGADAAVPLLGGLPFVTYAEYDYVVRHCDTPNDPSFGLLWGMHNTGQTVNGDAGTAGADINAPDGWTLFKNAPGFKVAIIDTGTMHTHADLAGNIWTNPGEIAGNAIDDDGNGYIDDTRGWDFYSIDNDPSDSDGHGTHTAGTVGAVGDNSVGVVGVAWDCDLVPLRFLGPAGGYTSDAVLAVNYCHTNGIKVSNNSWGGGGFSQSLLDAINNSASSGHLFIAAAGNNGRNIETTPFYPASYTSANLISVASTTNDDTRSSFSNYGATSVDLGAPGSTIYSTYRTGGYAYLSGTSMATPHVAGAAVLVYAQNPGWTYQQVKDRLMNTVRPIAALSGRCITGGVLDLSSALVVSNTAPNITITSPTTGGSFGRHVFITFSGSAIDTQDGDISSSILWSSSLQGALGSGASLSRNDLSVGTHVITAFVTDSGGLPASTQVTIDVTAAIKPVAPGRPTCTNLGGGQAQVVWADNSNNETSFEIRRQQQVSGVWTNRVVVGTTGTNINQFIDSPGPGAWRYQVRALNSAGGSTWSSYRPVTVTP